MLGTQKEDESCVRHEAAAGCGLPSPSLTVSEQFEETVNHLDEARQRIRARFDTRWPSALELGMHQQFSTADSAMHPKDIWLVDVSWLVDNRVGNGKRKDLLTSLDFGARNAVIPSEISPGTCSL
jgi:hypothetical protein